MELSSRPRTRVISGSYSRPVPKLILPNQKSRVLIEIAEFQVLEWKYAGLQEQRQLHYEESAADRVID